MLPAARPGSVAEVALLESVNIATPLPNPYKADLSTGIGKRAAPGSVAVRDPGPKVGGLGSGLVGDFVGDRTHHGGHEQAVYAFAREDLDDWQTRLNRELPNGFFGENLTTRGLDVSAARIGERWRIGNSVELQVTAPRTPCATFRGWVNERGWVKMFTEVARPGSYLRVVVPGSITAGDDIDIVHRPDHAVTVSLVYRALLTAPQLLPDLLAAGADLPEDIRELALAKHQAPLD